MPLWRVPVDWPGETVFVIGGGTSVARQNLSLLRGRKVVVVNSSYTVAPWATTLFFGDNRWWVKHQSVLLKEFAGEIVTVAAITDHPRVKILRKKRPPGPSFEPGSLIFRRTSFASAINLVALRGATTIVLLGADGKKGEDGRTHHHAAHPWKFRQGCWLEHYKDLRSMVWPLKNKGITVLNASPGTAWVDLWPVVPLELAVTSAVAA